MIVENKYSKKYNAFIDEMIRDKATLTAELSLNDKKISDLLHHLENENLNDDNEKLIIINKLIELRKIRRDIKNDLLDISHVLNRLKDIKTMKEFSKCDYDYRTDIISEL